LSCYKKSEVRKLCSKTSQKSVLREKLCRLSSFKLGGETSPEMSSMSSVPSGVAGAVPEVTGNFSEYGVRGGNEVGISTIDEYGVR